jgi:hypothetical protein
VYFMTCKAGLPLNKVYVDDFSFRNVRGRESSSPTKLGFGGLLQDGVSLSVWGEWGARVLGRGVAIMEEELGESLGRCALLAADADEADEAEGSGFSDLEDDVLAFILSFLSPSDIAACVRVSRRLRKLCNDDHKVVSLCKSCGIVSFGNG